MRAKVAAALRRPILCGRDLAPALVLLCSFVAAALQSCAVGERSYPQAERAVNEPLLRVRIAKEQPEADISALSRLEISSERGSRTALLAAPIRIRLTDAGWTAWTLPPRGVVPPAPATPPPDAQVFDRAESLIIKAVGAAAITFRGASYPGHVTLHAREDVSPGVFDVVEHVPMETYLPGVVAKEMYANWTPAAYEAQAIAARSYAIHERDRRRLRGESSDLDSTDADQVYGGLGASAPVLDAVRETRGLVLTWNGAPLRAYYSSTCGGRAASARDIWPTTKGFEFNLASPIQGRDRDHACQFSPLYRWTVARDASDVARRLAAWGGEQKMSVKAIKSVASIEMVRPGDTGRPVQYRIADAQGKTWTISAEQLRTALNFSGAKGLTPITRETRIHGSDFEAFTTGAGASARITFSGRGFGHGVGLCQFCAEGFARRGDSAEEMLLRFYPGAKITRAY